MTINAEPRQTFDQLAPEKRQRFIDASIEEFGRQPYRSASISAIVAELGIAKGSFYQYFENKAGLYVWLIHQMAGLKAAYLNGVEEDDLVATIRAAFVAGLNFWNNHPAWAKFAGQLLQPTGDDLIDNYLEDLRLSGEAWWEHRLRTAQDEGHVRADLDPTFAAPLINAMLSSGMRDVYRSALGAGTETQIDSDKILTAADAAIDLLTRGLWRSESPG